MLCYVNYEPCSESTYLTDMFFFYELPSHDFIFNDIFGRLEQDANIDLLTLCAAGESISHIATFISNPACDKQMSNCVTSNEADYCIMSCHIASLMFFF